MGRDHHHRNSNNKNKFRSNNKKPVDKSWHTESRLLETDVGIEKYISEIDKGFQGLIKSRFSDFHVNEIALNGELAVLTDFSIPQNTPAAAADDDESSLLILKEFVDEEKIKEINALIEGNDFHKSVLIEVTDYEKDRRGELHEILRTKYGGKVTSNTITSGTDRKFIQMKKFSRGDPLDKRGWQWNEEIVHFILFKENVDTLQACSLLANNLKIKASLFNYAGIKDKRAKTSQWISIKKMEPKKIISAASRSQGVRVGNFKFEKTPLKLGMLKGNRFRIALRSITAEEDHIIKLCESVKENGFINYYGLQRFGNCTTSPTYEIGKALLKSDYKSAVESILKERDGEPHFMKKMREHWTQTNDAHGALKFLDRNNNSIEAKILREMAKDKDKNYNYLQALQKLPRNMLQLYTHAYQSLIFNQVVSKRRELGMNVFEGDLVFKENYVNDEVLIEEKVEAEVEENETEETSEVETESKFKDMVRALTMEDVESGKYSIFDIVLVLPGHDITYPKGAIGDYYVELMNKDDLSSEKMKNKNKVFSLGGAYRKVFIKPDDFSYKFMKYDNHDDDLILSDYSRMRNDPEIESKPDGKLKALLLDFKLPGSTYATMLLRELLKTDTSIQTQIQLQNELTKNEESLKRDSTAVAESDEAEKCEKKLKVE